MRVGQYEVQLVDSSNEPYPERDIGGQIYTQGEADKEYQVKINVYRDAAGFFPADYLHFALYIDGVELLAKKRMDVNNLCRSRDPLQPASITIPGYPTECGAFQTFIFTPPNVSPDPIDNLDSSLGTIKLFTCEAEKKIPGPSTVQISENKKFWKQASLGTVAGEATKLLPPLNNPDATVQQWHTVREIPEGTLVLRYHLASTLDFLEELQNRICPRGYVPDGEASVSNTADRVVDLARKEISASRDRSHPSYRGAANTAVGQKRHRDDSRDNSRDRDTRRQLARGSKRQDPRDANNADNDHADRIAMSSILLTLRSSSKHAAADQNMDGVADVPCVTSPRDFTSGFAAKPSRARLPTGWYANCQEDEPKKRLTPQQKRQRDGGDNPNEKNLDRGY